MNPFKNIFGLILICFCLTAEAKALSTDTVLKMPNEAFWIDNYWRDVRGCSQFEPVHWRNNAGCIRVLDDEGLSINEKGLSQLYISGSAQPTLQNLKWLKQTYGSNHPIYIIDLRQETHLYVNDLPISIFYKKDAINWGKSPLLISTEENAWAKELLKKGTVIINKLGQPKGGLKVPTDAMTMPVKVAYTEKEAAKLAGVHYFRLYVPDYQPPTPAQVDQFIQLINHIPKNAWLHFHCAAGEGRTTTFMVMRDILANGKEVALEDIITRQARLGGINLLEVSESIKTQPWKEQYSKARIDYIKLFYTYVHSGEYLNQSFTQWINKQPMGPYKIHLKTEAYEQIV